MLGSPISLPRLAPKTTPAAGPESSVWFGYSVAMSICINPPFDCMMKSFFV